MNEVTKRRIANGVLAVSVVAAGAIVWVTVRTVGSRVVPEVVAATAPEPAPEPRLVRPPVVRYQAPAAAPEPVVEPVAPAPVPAPGVVPQFAPPVMSAPVFVSEADARVALAGVGRDPAAFEVWACAINDVDNLAPNERKNLIEDLNETGFADPRNLTAADLPVIENRLALIEAMYDDAADDTNAAAFDEAYKDLLNMRARLVGR